MATQKQRRKRAKEKRHEYELVYIDEEGVERPIERDEDTRQPPARSGGGASKSGGGKRSGPGSARGGGRQVQPPSWRKVIKRGGIFAPIFFATVLLLGGGKISYVGAVLQALLLLAVFVPFSYYMDRFMWVRQQKRLGRAP
jgi:hypothetical protein